MLNFTARSINRLIILLTYSEDVTNLRQIREIVNNIDWSYFIGENQTFAVKSNRVGTHSFSSLDMSRAIGQTIINQMKKTAGAQIKVNLSTPDVRIIAEAIDKTFMLGIDTSGLSLHIRRYRVYNHPMPLKTTLAYLLVRLSSWKPDEILLDPTCGGGTIPIEAALFAKKIPPVKFRGKEYLFFKLKFLDKAIISKVLSKVLEQRNIITKPFRIYGLDKNVQHVKGAQLNARNACVDDVIKFIVGDAEKLLNYFKPESIDKIIANPPYQLQDRNRLARFYHNFIKNIYKTLRPGGRSLIISSEITLMKKSLRAINVTYNIIKIFRYGKLVTGIFEFTK